ncbi:MAG: twin-arginine translocation signal domain-containing protein [Anaerolineales bacterium]|nr:twin-arginine translocation signal domain-containing protein [Anaerolineales bacterium]
MKNNLLSRRNFLKLAALGAGATLLPMSQISALARPNAARALPLPDFPNSTRLGRVLVGKTEIKARPDSTSATVAELYEDAVVPWLREVTGTNPFRSKPQTGISGPRTYNEYKIMCRKRS